MVHECEELGLAVAGEELPCDLLVALYEGANSFGGLSVAGDRVSDGRHQCVRHAAERRHDDDEAALPSCRLDDPCDVADAFGVGDRGSAELADDDGSFAF